MWDWIWTIWVAAVLGSFALFETIAIATRAPGGTLSEHVWGWLLLRDRKHRVWSAVLRTAAFGALAWLTVHLVFGVLPSA